MVSDTTVIEITNLLYQYAEYIDKDNLPDAGALFKHAKVKIAGSEHFKITT